MKPGFVGIFHFQQNSPEKMRGASQGPEMKRHPGISGESVPGPAIGS
jgi:hypothetical protein